MFCRAGARAPPAPKCPGACAVARLRAVRGTVQSARCQIRLQQHTATRHYAAHSPGCPRLGGPCVHRRRWHKSGSGDGRCCFVNDHHCQGGDVAARGQQNVPTAAPSAINTAIEYLQRVETLVSVCGRSHSYVVSNGRSRYMGCHSDSGFVHQVRGFSSQMVRTCHPYSAPRECIEHALTVSRAVWLI